MWTPVKSLSFIHKGNDNLTIVFYDLKLHMNVLLIALKRLISQMFSVMGVSTRVCTVAHNCHGNKKKHC